MKPWLSLVILLLAGCLEENKTGPVEVAWDRHVCELCGMMIGEPEFVAQVRGGADHAAHEFDDIGCAINWLNRQPWSSDPGVEIWVADQGSTRETMRWLDARAAFFAPGGASPMGYDMRAGGSTQPGSLPFTAMVQEVLAHEPNHICNAPGQEEQR